MVAFFFHNLTGRTVFVSALIPCLAHRAVYGRLAKFRQPRRLVAILRNDGGGARLTRPTLLIPALVAGIADPAVK